MKRLLNLLLAPLLAACSVAGIRTGTEEVGYEVVERPGDLEIRRYPVRLLAEIQVRAADAKAARNEGFGPLAGYIFGANAPRERIGMTAPVAQSGGERIGMTAPVMQQGEGGAWRIAFYMPARYDRASLPPPSDPRITVQEVPGETVAVLRFSGDTSPEAVDAARSRLAAQLGGTGWAPTGAGGAWFYDPPWTLPPLRRNEVWLPVTRRV